MALFMGLDSSTQGLNSVIIDSASGTIEREDTVNFGEDLPQFNCPQGFLLNSDSLVRHSDPLLWAAALDLLFTRIKEDGMDFSSVRGISGSGQQHGTVYLNAESLEKDSWKAGDKLTETVAPLLSRKTAPIWMDSSTSAECREITKTAGGSATVRVKTGSEAIERFSGPQIRKFYKNSPEDYERTARIHLVSSFMCSLLASRNAELDLGDGAGMNLLNLRSGKWDDLLTRATAPSLTEKLPDLVSCDAVIGSIAPYFTSRYGFSPSASLVAWSGDNPNSLIGVGGWKPGTAVISLGTSDTYFAAMNKPFVDPAGYGHVFGNPAGGFMSLICFKNGSLARENVKDQYNLSWQQFNEELQHRSKPGNNRNLMLPYFVPEITPLILNAKPEYRGNKDFLKGDTPSTRVRAVVESQVMSLKLHSNWIEGRTSVVRVTGGASASTGICRIIADVFDAKVERLDSTTGSAALGAAMRAANAVEGTEWEVLTDLFCTSARGTEITPDPGNVLIYQDLLPEFRLFLSEYLESRSP